MGNIALSGRDKDRLDRLVNIWIDTLIHTNEGVGWSAETVLAKVIKFKGDLPLGLGGTPEKVMRDADRLRTPHFDFPMIATAMRILLDEGKVAYVEALFAKNYYRHHNRETGKAWTDADRATKLGQDYASFRYNLGRGYVALKREMDRFEIYESMRKGLLQVG